MPRRCVPLRDSSGKLIGSMTVDVRRHSCSGCGRNATLQCDYPVTKPRRRSKTCDAWLCHRCSREVGPDRHHCKTHDPDPF